MSKLIDSMNNSLELFFSYNIVQLCGSKILTCIVDGIGNQVFCPNTAPRAVSEASVEM